MKIRSGEYRTWQQFDADFRLMCKNAKAFNELGSVISKVCAAYVFFNFILSFISISSVNHS